MTIGDLTDFLVRAIVPRSTLKEDVGPKGWGVGQALAPFSFTHLLP